MRRIDKFIAKLPKDQREKVVAVLRRIEARKTTDLNVKKLRGFSDRYHVRIGKVRIKFIMNELDVIVYYIDNRNENTYRDI